MTSRSPRLAARALIVHDDRVLLVNAFPNGKSDLWCAPGGGVERGQSIPDNLMREVHEETGLTITVGALVLVNEFHDPKSGFHQVELFFRCGLVGGTVDHRWTDPAGVVTDRQFFSRAGLNTIRYKPDSLPRVVFEWDGCTSYDPLERLVM
ncbi:NUDIX domain-containing protein [Actibacterium sp. XHP0104]|uniref:NUDIX domain-containing protein n=1 Tax=Actibacterium sp. XHP0104 TaxID=2984335 RepID=UPI0021E77860|nr:NUDIX domain-containing protein [Actibacterium sp. XHP0104]MCV2882256.1 NUDIX domain-containing protein [Actibacterium sp. XHP0104]